MKWLLIEITETVEELKAIMHSQVKAKGEVLNLLENEVGKLSTGEDVSRRLNLNREES